jgi:transposase
MAAAACLSPPGSIAELGVLEDERDELVAERDELLCGQAAQIAAIQRRLAELEDEIEQRDHRIAELEAAVAERDLTIADLRGRLSKNSRNSSKPPSSDGLSKPAADEKKNKRSLRGRSGRKQGGQEGHEGAHLQPVEVPDDRVWHEPECCEGCGGDLEGAARVEDGEESRQVFDLPEEIALEVIEHVAVRRWCGGCGTVSAGSFPLGVLAPVQYGPGVHALGVYLHVFQHIPYDRARQAILDLAGADVSTASIKAWVDRAAAGLTEFDEQLRGLLCNAPVVNFDETGARIAGRLGWIHSASTDTLTRYTAHARRGVEAMDDAGVLPGFTGVAVHDNWKPYRSYTDAVHALCGGHHLRELLAAQEAGEVWALGMSCLLLDTHDAVEQAKTAGLERLAKQALHELHASYRGVIALGYEQHPGLAENAEKKMKRTDAQNLLLRLDEREDEALRFAHDFRVPFTNNLAEQDIRMVKLQQKISGSWRTDEGAERYMRVRSYISTARKQGQRPIDVLSALAAGQPWLPQAAGP